MRMHALINNAVVKHKVPGSFHLFSDAKRSLMKIKCGAQESDCTFTLAHPFTKWTVDIRRSSLHVPASVVNIPVGFIVILALVCLIQMYPT